jgi:hypothetical protein
MVSQVDVIDDIGECIIHENKQIYYPVGILGSILVLEFQLLGDEAGIH